MGSNRGNRGRGQCKVLALVDWANDGSATILEIIISPPANLPGLGRNFCGSVRPSLVQATSARSGPRKLAPLCSMDSSTRPLGGTWNSRPHLTSLCQPDKQQCAKFGRIVPPGNSAHRHRAHEGVFCSVGHGRRPPGLTDLLAGEIRTCNLEEVEKDLRLASEFGNEVRKDFERLVDPSPK